MAIDFLTVGGGVGGAVLAHRLRSSVFMASWRGSSRTPSALRPTKFRTST